MVLVSIYCTERGLGMRLIFTLKLTHLWPHWNQPFAMANFGYCIINMELSYLIPSPWDFGMRPESCDATVNRALSAPWHNIQAYLFFQLIPISLVWFLCVPYWGSGNGTNILHCGLTIATCNQCGSFLPSFVPSFPVHGAWEWGQSLVMSQLTEQLTMR